MPHPVSLLRSNERCELSRQLHTLAQLLQRVPDAPGQSGHTAFFEAMRAVQIDLCAANPEWLPGADARAMLAIAQLERQPLNNDPLVFDLLRLLRAYGFLEGERRTQLTATLQRLVGRHLRLFWQEADVPLRAVAVARSQRSGTVNRNHLNLPWTLLPGQRGAERRVAANEPNAHPEAHRLAARPDGTEPTPLPAA